MPIKISEQALTRRYGDVVSSNMDESKIEKFVDFLGEHSFKNVRIERISKKTIQATGTVYNPDNSALYFVKGWTKMSDLEKWRILSSKFSFKTIYDEWLGEMPKLRVVFEQIKQYTKEELGEILEELEEDYMG